MELILGLEEVEKGDESMRNTIKGNMVACAVSVSVLKVSDISGPTPCYLPTH
jgi:hypothetical protein